MAKSLPTRTKRAGAGAAGKHAAQSRGKRSRRANTPTRTVAARKTAARAAATRTRKTRRKPAQPSTLQSAAAAVKGTVAGVVTTVRGSLPWPKTNSETDAIALLERDHRDFEALLERGEDTTERAVKERRDVLRRLADGLTMHELLEEKLLYPALETKAVTRAIALEGFEEHHVADILLKELQRLPPASERWTAKFKVLKESLEHHIKEEERHMFPNARGVLTSDELRQLAARMVRTRSKNGRRPAR